MATRQTSRTSQTSQRPSLTEAAFQQQVITLARLAGFLVYHTHDSRRSEAGYPDLTIAGKGRIIFAELKSERGRLRPEQSIWLATLRQCPGVEVAMWKPSNWPAIEATLLHGKPLATER